MGPLVRSGRNPGAAVYRMAADASARLLARSPSVGSILLHRSAATGEIAFGRSDIDLLMVIRREAAGSGEALASLCRKVRLARTLNPALSHIEVFEPEGIAEQARADTFWGTLTRRAADLLRGDPVEFPAVPVQPAHALARFLLWVETFFSASVQRRHARNLRKTALECWNAYAVSEGLIPEPYLLRREMDAHARRTEGAAATGRLGEASFAARFVLELAGRLHGKRLPAIGRLAEPLIFEADVAPLRLRRLFVVLPGPGHPLPREAFLTRAFLCTPELLHLYLHFKNAFLLWALPPELLRVGLTPPDTGAFLRDIRYFSHPRFLYLPGFADAGPPAPEARLICLRHALQWLERGEAPPPVPKEKWPQASRLTVPASDYYRNLYAALWLENGRLRASLRQPEGVSPA